MQEIAAIFNARRAFILSVLLVGLCYVNSLPNGFVFDDSPVVSANPVIRSINPIGFLASPYSAKQRFAGIYRPFTIFSLSVDYAVWKRWSPGFRLTNMTVHAVNGMLVFVLCQELAGPGIVPFVGMIVYAVHPVHNEALTSIVGRSDLFSACFFLCAWLLFRRGYTVWAAGVFFLALLSKENAIVLPAILLLDMWLSPGHSPPDSGGVFVRRLIPIVSVALAYLVLRYRVLGGLGIPLSAQYMPGHLRYVDRLLTSGRVFIQYLKLIFYPVDLAGDYDFNAIPIARITDWDAWLGLMLIGAIVGLAWRWRHSRSLLSFGLLFPIVALIPSSNWIMPISVLMAERFLYLPMIGVSLVAAVLYTKLQDPRLRRLIGGGGLVTAIILCNSHDYLRRDDFTFLKNMVRVEPNSAKARLGYGFQLINKGRNDEAVPQLEAGLRILPDHPELLAILALAKMTPTSCEQAWPLLKHALEIDPTHPDTHRRMGDCYLKEGLPREAEAMYRQAVEGATNPDAILYLTWGRLLEDLGDKAKAVAAYQSGVLIDPDNAFIRQRLAAAGAGAIQNQ
jgi:protein O-mannosyl-transferase